MFSSNTHLFRHVKFIGKQLFFVNLKKRRRSMTYNFFYFLVLGIIWEYPNMWRLTILCISLNRCLRLRFKRLLQDPKLVKDYKIYQTRSSHGQFFIFTHDYNRNTVEKAFVVRCHGYYGIIKDRNFLQYTKEKISMSVKPFNERGGRGLWLDIVVYKVTIYISVSVTYDKINKIADFKTWNSINKFFGRDLRLGRIRRR